MTLETTMDLTVPQKLHDMLEELAYLLVDSDDFVEACLAIAEGNDWAEGIHLINIKYGGE